MIKENMRIIVIDDNPDIHRDFIKILNISNHATKLSKFDKALFGDEPMENPESQPLPQFDIETASQGEEGVEKIKKSLAEGSPFALAFVDIRMPPGIDGIETIKKIWEFDKDIQIVICTAYSDYSWEDTVNILGISSNLLVLKKPFDIVAVRQLASALTHKWLIEKDTKKHTQSLNKLIDKRSESLKQSLALLRATIESSFDGILVLDLDENILDFNKPFVKFLSIPQKILSTTKETQLLNHMLEQMKNPKEFLQMIKFHRKKMEASSRQLITLKNSQIFECFSKPHRIGDKVIGRVWSFHEVTEKIQLKEKLEYQATHDALTDLPNRTLLLDRMSQEIAHANRDKAQFGVFFLDLDRFKFINDTLSHEAGDALLCAIAKRLSKTLRKIDTISRLGGDKFVMLFSGIKQVENALNIAEKLLSVFAKPFVIQKTEIKTSASIGISIYPSNGSTVNQLLSSADLAMYQAKSFGGNQFAFFTEELNHRSKIQFKLEMEIQKALKNQEFFLVYQAQFDIRTKKMLAVEALMRWQHPKKGTLLPKDFIPVAENSGLIVPLGEWAIHQACKQIKKWLKEGLPLMRVAVNAATKQLRQNNFSEKVAEILKSHDLPASCLELEITENVIIDKAIQQSIFKLKNIGCPIVLDDFGTGNSSLTSLRELNIDRLKIDHSFIHNIQKSPGDQAIVEAIIAISHSMDFKVIAEGVETENQMDFLKKSRCDEIQGFLWGKPLLAEEMTCFIKKAS